MYSVFGTDAIRQLKGIANTSIVPNQIGHMLQCLLETIVDFRYVERKRRNYFLYLRNIKNESKDQWVLTGKEYSYVNLIVRGRLCICRIEWEPEELYFQHLYPDEYQRIANLLHERRMDWKKFIKDFVIFLRAEIAKKNLKAEIYGRHKHIYSIWKKMKKKHLSFDEVFDVRAVRIVVDRLQDCYIALEIIHTRFRYLPSEFDNYVTNPKPNGYQSIHTVVFGPNNQTLEIQIRTRQMHVHAELGVAAHWKYKEKRWNRAFFLRRA